MFNSFFSFVKNYIYLKIRLVSMSILTKFKLFEDQIFGIKDIDYIDSFTEIFGLFSQLKNSNLIDENGKLLVDLEIINYKIPDFDDFFDTEDEYNETLLVIKEIINKYYKKI